jgi:hypothetical protein
MFDIVSVWERQNIEKNGDSREEKVTGTGWKSITYLDTAG